MASRVQLAHLQSSEFVYRRVEERSEREREGEAARAEGGEDASFGMEKIFPTIE